MSKTISDEEAWRIHELIEELHDFLHQPLNLQDSSAVERWLNERGVYRELHDVYYNMTGSWFQIDDTTGEVQPPPGARRRFARRDV